MAVGVVDAEIIKTTDAGQAIEELSFFIERAGEIETGLGTPIVAEAREYVVACFCLRLLTDKIDQATGIAGAIEDGGRAACDFDTIDEKRIHGGYVVVDAGRQLQSVPVMDVVGVRAETAETSDVDAIKAFARPRTGGDAGLVA
ncbi:hypothetical protein RRH01S_05_03570 [Rhizobium rhizogenes NBRC 13257]|uniref:Uncharacterized protein n=1 Tax=Rhizobium rhizogenes NBRC 13257 TaxID=1220581 RepID=A0AA87U497_RHIRH|nr:hypothetical protein RRH01S_05_03570 [Rhizobium rhizogenes NBRC 13257]